MSIPSVVRGTSEPKFDVEIEWSVPVPMRDGSVLRADVYRPAANGRFPFEGGDEGVHVAAFERVSGQRSKSDDQDGTAFSLNLSGVRYGSPWS